MAGIIEAPANVYPILSFLRRHVDHIPGMDLYIIHIVVVHPGQVNGYVFRVVIDHSDHFHFRLVCIKIHITGGFANQLYQRYCYLFQGLFYLVPAGHR